MYKQAFTVFALVIFTRAFLFIIFTDIGTGDAASIDLASDTPVTARHPEILLTYIAIYAISALMIASRWREVVQLAYREKYMALLLIAAALSSLWSGVPGLTLARTVALAGCTLFGVFFALSYTPGQQLKLLAWAAIIIITSSYFTAFYYPEAGIMTGFHEGLWRGVYAHKNALGRAMSLGLLALFLLGAQPGCRKPMYWGFFWVGLVLLLLSSSRLSLAVFISIFVALGGILFLKEQRRLAGIALLAVVVTVTGLFVQVKYKIYPSLLVTASADLQAPSEEPDIVSSPRGQISHILKSAQSMAPGSSDNTYLAQGAGRKQLWQLCWDIGRVHPWLGYGFGGVWRGTQGPSGEIWSKIERWNPSDAHNGFLDLWLELGALGLGLFLVSASISCSRAFKRLRASPFDPASIFVPGSIAFVLLSNIGESDLLMPNYICWILYVSSTISLLVYSPRVNPSSGIATAPRLS